MIQAFIGALGPSADVVIPETAAGLEPLCAIYSRQCLPHIEKLLNRGQFKIQSFFPSVRVSKINEAAIRSADPDLISFFNINTLRELDQAEAWLESGQNPFETDKGDTDV